MSRRQLVRFSPCRSLIPSNDHWTRCKLMEGLQLTFHIWSMPTSPCGRGQVLTWMRIYLMFNHIVNSSSRNPFPTFGLPAFRAYWIIPLRRSNLIHWLFLSNWTSILEISVSTEPSIWLHDLFYNLWFREANEKKVRVAFVPVHQWLTLYLQTHTVEPVITHTCENP